MKCGASAYFRTLCRGVRLFLLAVPEPDSFPFLHCTNEGTPIGISVVFVVQGRICIHV